MKPYNPALLWSNTAEPFGSLLVWLDLLRGSGSGSKACWFESVPALYQVDPERTSSCSSWTSTMTGLSRRQKPVIWTRTTFSQNHVLPCSPAALLYLHQREPEDHTVSVSVWEQIKVRRFEGTSRVWLYARTWTEPQQNSENNLNRTRPPTVRFWSRVRFGFCCSKGLPDSGPEPSQRTLRAGIGRTCESDQNRVSGRSEFR